jgi:hypothetical protein
MPRVLTTNAIITCPHAGLGTSLPLTPWWKALGGAVLQENDAGVIACPFLPLPCVGYKLRSMGLNATRVGGRRVVLATDFQQSFTGLPLLILEKTPVFDDSTPAPLPPGVPAPPLSPALADVTRPVATATTPSPPPVVKSTAVAPLVFNFAIISPFPSRWQLTWLNLVTGPHTDLTNGSPPDVTVVPAGGAWDTPSKTVTVTLATSFLTGPALSVTSGVKNHHFVLTAINQRGLWGSAEVTLDVSL